MSGVNNDCMRPKFQARMPSYVLFFTLTERLAAVGPNMNYVVTLHLCMLMPANVIYTAVQPSKVLSAADEQLPKR